MDGNTAVAYVAYRVNEICDRPNHVLLHDG